MNLKRSVSLISLGLCLSVGPVMVIVTGCGTTPVQTTIKAESVLITSVDVGMNLWRDHVVAHLTDGKVTQKQIDTIHQAYDGYVAAQSVAKAVIEKALTSGSTNQADVDLANQAVQSAENDLLSLLNLYLK